jgi:putative resolvase
MLRPKDAAQQFGVGLSTLKRWEREGRISAMRTHGNHRRYSRSEVLESAEAEAQAQPRKRYAYCRVSSHKQKDDLERQKQSFQQTHPDHEIIADIGSGLNFKRKGLLRMVDEVLRGDVEEIVVSHKDRLCRFAFELIEHLCRGGDTRLVVKNQEILTAEQELSEDLMAIVHVFSCRHHGMRRYTKQQQNDTVSKGPDVPDSSTSQDSEDVDESREEDLQPRSPSHKKSKGQLLQLS